MKVIVETRNPLAGLTAEVSGECTLTEVYEGIMSRMAFVGVNPVEWKDDFIDWTGYYPLSAREWDDVTRFILANYDGEKVREFGLNLCIGDWLWKYCKRDYFGVE